VPEYRRLAAMHFPGTAIYQDFRKTVKDTIMAAAEAASRCTLN
jgi:hypothetical protein